MCGIVGFLEKRGRRAPTSGAVVLSMLRALARRGPDGAGVALWREAPDEPTWNVRIAPADAAPLGRLAGLGRVECVEARGETLRFAFLPAPGVTPDELGRALGEGRGGPEVLCLGPCIDLVKQVGSPDRLEEAYGVSSWRGPLAIGHTRMSTESRIDLGHSQPFWARGRPDLATVHNGHVTNYHRLRRLFEQRGAVFTTDNDSEVIGVYLRDRLERGRSLAEAMRDSLADLDGAYNYLAAAPEGLGIVRDRFGFKPLVVAETDDFVAAATEELALRRALPGDYRAFEPPPGSVLFFERDAPAPAGRPALSVGSPASGPSGS